MNVSNFLLKRWKVAAAIGVWLFVFLELVRHESQQDDLFGRYSPGFLGVLVVYSLLIIPLVGSLIRPEPLQTLTRRAVRVVQAHTWTAVPVLVGLVFTANFFAPAIRLENFPAAQLVIVAGSTLAIPGLILYGWGAGEAPAAWRRISLGLLLVVVFFEIGVQVLSAGRWLPAGFSTEAGLYKPYGRLYDAEFGNRITNRYGWFSEPFELDGDPYRILLLGDEILYARGLPTEQHLDAVLEAQLGPGFEVIAMGAPGSGPAQYYEGVKHTLDFYQPDEIILFLNLPDDLVNMVPELNMRPPQTHVYYRFEEGGFWNIHPASIQPQHILFHRFTDATRPLYAGVLPSIRSHLLGGKLLNDLFNGGSAERNPGAEAVFYDGTWTDQAETALALTIELLKISRQAAAANGVTLRIVTLPALDGSQAAGPGADPLRPEQAFLQAAAGGNLEVWAIGERLAGDGFDSGRFDGPPGCGCWHAAGYAWLAEILAGELMQQP